MRSVSHGCWRLPVGRVRSTGGTYALRCHHVDACHTARRSEWLAQQFAVHTAMRNRALQLARGVQLRCWRRRLSSENAGGLR